MKANHFRLIMGLLLSLFFFTACQEDKNTVSTVAPTISGNSDSTYTLVDTDSNTSSFNYTQDLGASPKDVYFIFTNTSSANITSSVNISSSSESAAGLESPKFQSPFRSENYHFDITQYAREHGIGLRSKPEIAAYNANPPKLSLPMTRQLTFSGIAKPHKSTVGDTHTFMNESETDTIDATLRATTTDGNITLYLWVADDAWGGNCSKWYCMDQNMVDAFAARFLQSGDGNDIYDWDTNIFGAPWGTHPYTTELIDAAADQEIDILFFDIDDDGNSTDSEPAGGVLGYFWSKDNYKNSYLSSINQDQFSNERLIFYMDSVLSADPEGDTWEISDYWPAEMISTLAHEFQHMIHFYQKTVVRTGGSGTETWLNEMCSMMAEDLLADKMEVNGPRGVDYSDGTAGGSSNSDGRLPLYAGYDYLGVIDWFSGNQALYNYAVNYAFGSYLGRNFGGAELFQKIVQNDNTDSTAIDTALSDLGYSETFASVLQKWGVSVLLSDSTSADSGYQYNTGDYFSSTLNDITYHLGSINMYNYLTSSGSGPYTFTPSNVNSLGGHYKTSNTFVKIGSNLSGSFSRMVDLPTNMKMAVVVKDSQ